MTRTFGKSKGLRLPEFLRAQISRVAAAERLTETEATRLLIMSGLANREAAINGRSLTRQEGLADRLEAAVAKLEGLTVIALPDHWPAPDAPPGGQSVLTEEEYVEKATQEYKAYYDEREFSLPPSYEGRPR